jgi:O-antigen ligase
LTAGASEATVPCRRMHRVSASSFGQARNRARRSWSAVLVPACLLLVSVGLGRAVVETQAIDASARDIALTLVAVAAGLAVILSGPVACLAAVAAVTVVQVAPHAAAGGGVDLGPADVFFCALVCWWVIRRGLLVADSAGTARRSPVRGWPVLLFLCYAGLTLLYVAAVDPGRLSVSFVSWLRLVETASLGWLAAAFLRTRRDVIVVLGAIALAGAVTIGLAVTGAARTAGLLDVRGGGVINPNTLGLISGLLVLMAIFGGLGPSLLHRVPLALWGTVGLLQSRSVGSLVGTLVALVLALAFMVPHQKRIVTASALRGALAVVAGLALAYSVATVIRPENLPTSQEFHQSSAGQRTVLGAAGLELTERHPLIGVGWRRSDQPDVIGDPELNAELRARFPETPSAFFPDVNPASVHNAYIQVAAELGLIGLGLLLLMLASLGRDINNVLKRVPRAAPEHAPLWFLAWGLVLVLIWKNDNPIYGGQADTLIPVVLVGAIAGLARTLDRPASRGRRGA